MTETVPAKSDLGVRTLSAIAMVTFATIALWLGGWVFTAFAAAIGVGVLWEWWGLVGKLTASPLVRAAWMIGGLLYVGQAVIALIALRYTSISAAVLVIAAVVAVDIGAYFAGRTFGGPTIAPRISPSKTWAGLLGGMTGASSVNLSRLHFRPSDEIPVGSQIVVLVVLGCTMAIVAQAGDFFESWMKRRAGVKDSGHLIPGHGGLFDRTDGLIAVLFLFSIIYRLPL